MNLFHFLRVEALWLMLPLILLIYFLYHQKRSNQTWQAVIDPKLLPHLLIGQDSIQKKRGLLVLLCGGLIAIIALAGPVWEKRPQPVFEQKSALVIVLDLSRSMNATDFKPSRLSRARHKLLDLLSQRSEGQTALIAYAGSAFVVSPLTSDVDTIASLVPSLQSNMMPAQGSRADRALLKASELLAQAGISGGDILLITDGVSDRETSLIKQNFDAKHRLSIFSVASEQGAPIKLASGGFLQDAQGSIVVPKLEAEQLISLSSDYRGIYQAIRVDDEDLENLHKLLAINLLDADSTESDLQADVWREAGPALLLMLIPFAALAFRRGLILAVVFVLVPLPTPSQAFSWNELWLNNNQRAQRQFEQDQHQSAAELFTSPEWKAAAQYRAGDYESSLGQLESIKNPSVETRYNKANALANLGQLQSALDEYEEILKQQPEHEDSLFNQKQVKKALNQQKQEEQSSDDQSQNSNDQDSDKSSENENSENQSTESKETSEQQADGQPADNKQENEQDSSSAKQAEQDSDTQNKPDKTKTDAAENDGDLNDKQPSHQPLTQQQKLSKQAAEQWLRKIPDDPGGLLRRKFSYQYQRSRQLSGQALQSEDKPW